MKVTKTTQILSVLATGVFAFAIGLGFNAASNNDSNPEPTAVTDPGSNDPYSTNPGSNDITSSNVQEECQSTGNDIADLWMEYGNTLQLAVDSGTAAYIIDEAYEAGTALVTITQSWLNLCDTYFPAVASEFRSLLNTVRPLLDELR